MTTRNGTAQWQGDLESGAGTVSVASGLFDGQYSFATRFENQPGTNPEELIGAAHAACFSMALANMLAQDGHVATSISTTANVQLRNVDGAPTITRIELVTEGDVPGIGEEQFRQYAQRAKEGCPVSRALAGVREMELDATLKR